MENDLPFEETSVEQLEKIFSTILSVLVSFFVLLILCVVFISVAISALENEKDIVAEFFYLIANVIVKRSKPDVSNIFFYNFRFYRLNLNNFSYYIKC